MIDGCGINRNNNNNNKKILFTLKERNSCPSIKSKKKSSPAEWHKFIKKKNLKIFHHQIWDCGARVINL